MDARVVWFDGDCAGNHHWGVRGRLLDHQKLSALSIPPHVEPPVSKVGLQTQLGNDTTAVVGQIIFDAVPAALAPSPGINIAQQCAR